MIMPAMIKSWTYLFDNSFASLDVLNFASEDVWQGGQMF